MRDKSSRSGFTLVEIALALLVAGLGIMGVFALFPQAMDTSRKSVDASEISAFADFVFDGLQTRVDDTNYTWTSFDGSGANHARVNASHALLINTQKLVTASNSAPGNTSAQLFNWIPAYYGGVGGGASVGWELYVTTNATATFTYRLDIGQPADGRDVKYARLEVWPGNRVGPVNQGINSGVPYPGGSVFYKEFLPVR